MGLGYGWGHVKSTATFSTSGLGQPAYLEAVYDGGGPAYELLLGGTIARGLVLGGGLVGQDISDPSLTVSTDAPGSSQSMTASGALGVGALGPFLDWFPNDRGGLHFGTMTGLAVLGLSDGSGKSPVGFAGALWGGHDFWISDQWSLGGELRIIALTAKRNFSGLDGSSRDNAISVEAVFTAVYH